MLDLSTLNTSSRAEFVARLEGIYEHSPWIAERAWEARPFISLAALKAHLARVVREASRDEQLGLIRAHPELAGKAAVAGELTPESTHEQSRAGLSHCTPQEFARIRELNAAYAQRFGWPFILAVLGPRGSGLSRADIIDEMQRRVDHDAGFEFAESLRQIHRIAEMRLNQKFGWRPELGEQVWDWCERLAMHSESPWLEQGQLTATYLTAAHRACAADLQAWMRECGFDEVRLDAVGNVVGLYHGNRPDAPRLLTGSHYDTVRNAGRFDGRVGIFVPMACVRELARAGRRLPFAVEVVGFAEEEGQRYTATFLGSGALVGEFDPAWLDLLDAGGVSLRQAMRDAGLPGEVAAIAGLRRDASKYLGFIEVHIEQGPVLNALDLPLGVVTSINASVRCTGEVVGMASHAGTTPMQGRRDAACAVADLVLLAERCAAAEPDAVATVGQLEVPGGSVNVVPGRCRFSLDVRAPSDAARDRVRAAVEQGLREVCERRGVRGALQETMRERAAPSDPGLQARWERAVRALGLPLHRMPSGAGHDAMKLHRLLAQAMLFVRGTHAGIS
ncbi:MAG: 2-oxo-4-hydroxy-4-carboxy-5-ureidoimidazoline decarboxylase, partial [Betaproteobacteria bacterium]|nr:2-oxo-4-hydroxy-4-carboxy-5-ureidoimidazoline decarboxylase [Betaproteobacteria bacterium]